MEKKGERATVKDCVPGRLVSRLDSREDAWAASWLGGATSSSASPTRSTLASPTAAYDVGGRRVQSIQAWRDGTARATGGAATALTTVQWIVLHTAVLSNAVALHRRTTTESAVIPGEVR